MKTEFFSFAGHGGLTLPAVLWLPEETPIAILQITHGMTEHMGRYEQLAEELCRHNIAVAGFDLRGHGKNPGDPKVASFGQGGWEASLEDMRLFFWELQRRLPQLPHHMLGFSLGSFLLREYLSKYPEGLASAIIAGTGHQPGWLLGIMTRLVQGQIRKAGFDRTTDLVRQLSFGTYNQGCKPNRTSADWLCADPDQVDQYLADPLVRQDISAGLFGDLLRAMARTGTPQAYAGWNKQTPILLLHGSKDPVGDQGKGVLRIYKQMTRSGLSVAYWGLPEARHDIFHEEAGGLADSVRHEIADWLLSRWEEA